VSAARRARATQAGLGWLATLGGAGILLICGFGVGLVAGSALEEPDLVARHLSGEATELPLPKEAPAATRPAAQTPPEPGARAREAAETAASDFDAGDAQGDRGAVPEPVPGAPKPESAAKAATPPPPPRAPAPVPEVASRPSGFAIQVGAFADRRAADELVASLRGDRLRAYVAQGGAGEAAPFRVRVGPYGTRAEANDEAARLHARRRLPTWVIAEGGP
jgi:DedD protein